MVQLSASMTPSSLNHKSQVSLKEAEVDDASMYVPFTSRPILASEITYQRLSRLGRVPSTTSVPSRNESVEDKPVSSTPISSSSISSSSSRSLSEPRRRSSHHDTQASVNNKTSTTLAPPGQSEQRNSSMMSIAYSRV